MNKSIAIRLMLLLLTGFYSTAVCAQALQKDAVAWLSLSARQQLTKKLSARLQTRFRMADNFTLLQSYYADLGAYYRFSKHLRVSLDYVYAPSRTSHLYFRNFNQYYASVTNSFDLTKNWSVHNRVIVQYTSNAFLVPNHTEFYSRLDLRDKVTLEWEISRKNTFYIADEIMAPVSQVPFEVKRNRFYCGMNTKISKHFNIDYYFVLQNTFHRKISTEYFIYGLSLNYNSRKIK